MAVQNDNTLVTKGDLKELYTNKIAPYLGINISMNTNNKEYYSTDEKVVGVWIDGKPLYQVSAEKYVNTTSWYTVFSLGSTVDIKDYHGIFKQDSSNIIETNTNWDGTNYCAVTANYPSAGSVSVSVKRTGTFIGTVWYTKTTDTASTALTIPGCYDINFPNTWPENTEIYFGNGIYGFRIVMSNITFSGYYSTIPAVNGPDHNCKMISSGGYARTNNNGSDHVIVCYFNANDTLGLKGNWTSGSITQPKIDVWVTYTK